MDFELTPDQQDLQQRARDLARTVFAARAPEIDRSEKYPWDNAKALNEAGFMGMTIPREYGGQGRSFGLRVLDSAVLVDVVVEERLTVEVVADEIAARSITLVRDNANLLPLKPTPEQRVAAGELRSGRLRIGGVWRVLHVRRVRE